MQHFGTMADGEAKTIWGAEQKEWLKETLLASDGLPQLFALSDPVLGISRDLALAGLDLLPALRRLFVQQAAGMAALEAGNG